MGTHTKNNADLAGKTQLFRTRPTPFVVRWRALQHELAFKTARLDFLKEISEIVPTPRRVQNKISDVSREFRKSLFSDSMAS